MNKHPTVETWEHITHVMALLSELQIEIMHRSFTHDRSKLLEPEIKDLSGKPEHSYGSDEYRKSVEQKKEAIAHHYHHNRHHPEHFEDGIEGMNLVDILEMFVDWYASSARDGKSFDESVSICIERFGICPQLASVLHNSKVLLKDKDNFIRKTSQRC